MIRNRHLSSIPMKKIRSFLCLLLITSLPVAALAKEAPDKTKLKAEVAAMEDSFCAMAKDKGLLAAFQYFAAPDVSFIDTDPRKWHGFEVQADVL